MQQKKRLFQVRWIKKIYHKIVIKFCETNKDDDPSRKLASKYAPSGIVTVPPLAEHVRVAELMVQAMEPVPPVPEVVTLAVAG